MLAQGKINHLKIIKRSTFGLYLGDASGQEVLLPNKYCTEEMKPEGALDVFIYRDSEDRPVATTLTPKILLHEFALLKVSAVTRVGAFLDWGLEKELMVPFREQRQKMEAGRWYIVYLDLDQKTDRLYASNRLERFLSNEVISVREGEEVEVIVLQKTDLGYAFIINHKHKGLVFRNDIFHELHIGDRLKAYVKKIREDQKIDISLQPIGYRKSTETNSERIYRQLMEHEGFLPLTDRSSPEEISALLGISKKAFKTSIGALYKQKKIAMEEAGIRLLK
jgi:predicted RNA-binding protein (virulence factor B family)